MSKRIEVEIVELFEQIAGCKEDVVEILSDLENGANFQVADSPVYIKLRILERFGRLSKENQQWILTVLKQRYQDVEPK